jgi:hypothetical protein
MIDKTKNLRAALSPKPGKAILNEEIPLKEIAADTAIVYSSEDILCHNRENKTCKGKSCCKGAITK